MTEISLKKTGYLSDFCVLKIVSKVVYVLLQMDALYCF